MRPLVVFVIGLVLLVLFAVNQPGESVAQDRCPNGQCPTVQIPKSVPVPTVESPAVDLGSCENGVCNLQPAAQPQAQASSPQSRPRFGQRARSFVRQPFGGFFRRAFGRR